MPATPPANGTEPTTDLVARVTELEVERDEYKRRADEYKRLYLEMMALCRKLENGVVGSGRERDLGKDGQLAMSLLALMTGEASADAEQPAAPEPERTKVPAHERSKPTGRKPLPDNLPRIEIELLPPEVKALGTDAFVKIGEDTCETVERRRASLVVVRTVRPKFVEKGRDLDHTVAVEQAEPMELPIERGLPGPGLLAETIVQRWEEHLPLHRLERVYGREGLPLARSTICDWHMQAADLVKPLADAMWEDALRSPYVCTDATGVLVQQKDKCRTGHFFVVAAPPNHVLFGYSPKHNKAAIDALLGSYEGTVLADASAIYDHLYLDGKRTEAGCNAHCRRYFFKALPSEPQRARVAIEHFRKLFAHEKLLQKCSPEERLKRRLELSKPLVDEFERWCDLEVTRVLDETPLARALNYAKNHRAALRRFLEDGRIPIHNNLSERELRREAVGRKNWLFLGSDTGGETNATFVSLLASCRLHDIEPAGYLRDLFCLLPRWSQLHLLDLSPLHWRKTLEREDVRSLLAGNVYRQVALGQLVPASESETKPGTESLGHAVAAPGLLAASATTQARAPPPPR